MQQFMKEALIEAKKALAENEVPVGAVIIKDNKIIGTGRNCREAKQNALGHAEIEAISKACEALGSWRLDGCDLYVTLEPCPMCAGAIINSRISRVIYGADDFKAGSCGSLVNLFSYPYNHKPEVIAGICGDECREILSNFFKNLR